jgi:dipeptidyl aminopeptidase/acylaminoacyl peptidase
MDQPTLIPRNILFGNPSRMGVRISPDGKLIGYIAPHEGVLNVWVRTAGAEDDRAITNDRKRGIRGFSWQYDGEHILYSQDTDGDENNRIYQTNVKTNVTRCLTPFNNVKAGIVGGDRKFPNELLVSLNIHDPMLHDVYRLDLTSGFLTFDTKNPGDSTGFVADNNMVVRIREANLPDGTTVIYHRSDANSEWTVITQWGPNDHGGVLGFSPDNKKLWMFSSVDSNAERLVEFDLESRSINVLFEDPQYDVGGIMVHPETEELQAVFVGRDKVDRILIDTTLQADFDLLQQVKPGEIGVVSRTLDDKVWLVAFTSDAAPIYWYLYDRTKKETTQLFCHRPELEEYTLSQMVPIHFTARDGLVIHGYLTLPAGLEPKNLPMVINVHGGPWTRDHWGLDPEVQWLANRGYAVLQVNYRGSSGYGKAFLNAGDREWGNKMHFDVLDAKKWAIDQGYANPDKVAIYGGSYGGYETLVGLTFTPTEFCCGVDIVGVSNLVTFLNSIPPYWETMRGMMDKQVGKLDDVEFLKSRSPFFKADQIVRPLLIAQGTNDPRVKKAESDQIVGAVRGKGRQIDYLVFGDEGHGFARPQNRMKFYAAAEKFLAEHLGGRQQAPSAEEDWTDVLQ